MKARNVNFDLSVLSVYFYMYYTISVQGNAVNF